jgi:hypothetical protein
MLVLAHGDAVAFREARAHAVGARFALAPERAHAKAVWRDGLRERHGRHLMKNGPLRVHQHDGEFRVGELLVERGHFELRARDEIAQRFAARAQFVVGEHRRRDEAGRVEVVLVHATRPRLRHGLAHGPCRQLMVDDVENFTGVHTAVGKQRHGTCLRGVRTHAGWWSRRARRLIDNVRPLVALRFLAPACAANGHAS